MPGSLLSGTPCTRLASVWKVLKISLVDSHLFPTSRMPKSTPRFPALPRGGAHELRQNYLANLGMQLIYSVIPFYDGVILRIRGIYMQRAFEETVLNISLLTKPRNKRLTALYCGCECNMRQEPVDVVVKLLTLYGHQLAWHVLCSSSVPVVICGVKISPRLLPSKSFPIQYLPVLS